MNLQKHKLIDICSVNTGKKDANHNTCDGNYPFFTCADKPLRSPTYSFDGESIIIPGNGANVGLVFYYNGKLEAYQRTYVLNDFRGDCKYIYYHLNYYWKVKNANTQYGSATNYIRMQNFIDYEILLPSLSEQKRIVNIFENADSLRQKRRESIKLLDEFLRSTFLEMFSNSKKKNYILLQMSDIAEKKNGSMRTGPFGSSLLHSEFVNEGIAVLGIDNAVENHFTLKERRFITLEKYKQLKQYTVYPGDIIITIMGTLGRSAVVPDNIPTAINTKHLACITLNKEIANPYFVVYSIQSDPDVVHQLNSRRRGAIMDGLNLTIIKNIKFNLPPLVLQERFVEIMKKVNGLKQKLEASQKELDNQFNALTQKYFG